MSVEQLLENPQLEGMACIACGGVRAAPADGTAIEGVCLACWNGFEMGRRKLIKQSTIENDFNKFLARRIHTTAKRYGQTKILGRCEAISKWVQGGSRGYQCARPATMQRDGRNVCGRHGTIALRNDYVGANLIDPYQVLQDLIVRVGMADERFAALIRDAAARL